MTAAIPNFHYSSTSIGVWIFLLMVFFTGSIAQSQCGQLGACYMCSLGYYPNCTGQDCPLGSCISTDYCVPCDAGTFSANCTQLTCTACDEGTVSGAASSYCTPCTAGTYSNVSECSPCPVGSFSTGPTAQCSPCGSGKYNPRTNSPSESYCIPCPPGYYCPSDYTQYPLICPAHFFCKANSVKPTACRFLFVSQSCSTSCKPSTLFWALIALASGFVLVFVLLLIMKGTKTRLDQQEKIAKEKETASLIPKPLPGPVYGGY